MFNGNYKCYSVYITQTNEHLGSVIFPNRLMVTVKSRKDAHFTFYARLSKVRLTLTCYRIELQTQMARCQNNAKFGHLQMSICLSPESFFPKKKKKLTNLFVYSPFTKVTLHSQHGPHIAPSDVSYSLVSPVLIGGSARSWCSSCYGKGRVSNGATV